ncbi:SDR family oxidoreductase [Sphingopyxis sp.]|uniref:SDR family oxidoreductase n=1 Tax=Sphingopyxis sp. TaxID=1908224 RepID=UPI003BAD3E8D
MLSDEQICAPGARRDAVRRRSCSNAWCEAEVVTLTKTAAVRYGNIGYRIRVDAIIRGVVKATLIDNPIEASGPPEALRAAYDGMPMPKWMATVDDVAGLAGYLASDAAAFISGREYVMDWATTTGTIGV